MELEEETDQLLFHLKYSSPVVLKRVSEKWPCSISQSIIKQLKQ